MIEFGRSSFLLYGIIKNKSDHLWQIITERVIIYPVHLCRDAAFSGRLSHDTFFYSVGLAVLS